jgi:hypothetical protein
VLRLAIGASLVDSPSFSLTGRRRNENECMSRSPRKEEIGGLLSLYIFVFESSSLYRFSPTSHILKGGK